MRLEYLRGAASFYIFLQHYVLHGLPEYRDVLMRYFIFGQLAVLIFFLLSGFVVHYATLGRDPHMSFSSYFVRRFRRIYPIFGIALILAYVSACVVAGRLVDPSLRDLALNLAQVQGRARPGNWVEPYMHNLPLWSLAYEWWFYMAYFALHVLHKGRPHRQKYAVLGIAVVGLVSDVLWPNPLSHIASYLVIWWFGVELAREYLAHGAVTFKNQWFSFASILVITALWAVPVLTAGSGMHRTEWFEHPALTIWGAGRVDWYNHPGLTFRHFVSVAVLICGGWAWYKVGLVGFDRLFGFFGRVAPVSYALYVIHFPLLVIFAHFGGTGWWAFLYIAPAILLVSWLAEQPLQKRINRLLRAPSHREHPAFKTPATPSPHPASA